MHTTGVLIGTDGNGVSDTLERNIVSGNIGWGIGLDSASNIKIAGNYIGLNAAGTAAIPNTGSGVLLAGKSRNNIIGTDSSDDAFNANEKNLISGNSIYGVHLWGGSGAKFNTIAGNWIGLSAAGDSAIPNSNTGLFLEKSTDTRIGTDGDGYFDQVERNVISGNYSEIGILTGNAFVYGLEVVDKVLSNHISSSQTTGSIQQADLSDAGNPANGTWGYNHPIPGGGSSDYFVLVTGSIEVNVAGTYSFAISGDDGGRLKIGNQSVIIDDNQHGFESRYGQATLGVGQHSFEWIGFNRVGSSGWELSVSNLAENTHSVSTANGWKVLGDPNPHPQLRLAPSTNLSVTSYKVNGSEQTNIVVAGNYIGSNAAGTEAISNGQIGVGVGHSRFVTIGGSSPAMANVFSGTSIRIDDYQSPATDVTIEGNLVGLDASGMNPRGGSGVQLVNVSRQLVKNNIVAAAAGIQINGGSEFEIIGNTVGLAIDGVKTTATSVGGIGVYSATKVQIGTDGDGQNDSTEGNLISSIYLEGVSDAFIAGNTVGTTKNYTPVAHQVSNSSGIHARNSSRICVGTDGSADEFNASERNVIAGKLSHGIFFENTSQSTIAGNLIGVVPNGTKIA
ncbi:MAG: PA14 domain-containing protein, partial [Pirellula sp.]